MAHGQNLYDLAISNTLAITLYFQCLNFGIISSCPITRLTRCRVNRQFYPMQCLEDSLQRQSCHARYLYQLISNPLELKR